MDCSNTRELLNAFVDAELTPDLTEKVQHHLDSCPACTSEVAALEQLTKHLDNLPEVHTPATIARRTLNAFRAGMEKPTIADWWHTMSFHMRGVVCGMALAGLLLGLFLGGSFSFLPDTSANSFLISFYNPGGILP